MYLGGYLCLQKTFQGFYRRLNPMREEDRRVRPSRRAYPGDLRQRALASRLSAASEP